MPITIHIGVTEMHYTSQPAARPSRKRVKLSTVSRVTTGDVAEILERKYHVMELLWHAHEQENADLVVDVMRQSLETLLAGGPTTSNPIADATSEIEKKIKMGLSLRELDSFGYPGIPTMAAQEGKSPRFKSGGGPVRPSFIYSGLYQSSIRVWSD